MFWCMLMFIQNKIQKVKSVFNQLKSEYFGYDPTIFTISDLFFESVNVQCWQLFVFMQKSNKISKLKCFYEHLTWNVFIYIITTCFVWASVTRWPPYSQLSLVTIICHEASGVKRFKILFYPQLLLFG